MSDKVLEMRGPVHGTKDAKRVAAGSSVGAVIETYDFIGFGTAAALYFGTAFFPNSNSVTGTLAAFATLGVGFAARPLGGIVTTEGSWRPAPIVDGVLAWCLSASCDRTIRVWTKA